MYLIDTNVISEQRKNARANSGVKSFVQQTAESAVRCYISVITIGELS